MTTPRSGARPTDESVGSAEPIRGTLPRAADELGEETVVGERIDAPGRPAAIERGATLGRYVVLDRLGSGGMGVVFAAYDPELDRKVAVKVLQPGSSRSPNVTAGRARLLREAQAMAKLSHPNVIAVYDVGTIGEDVFLAMEFIAGRTLKAWVAHAREQNAFDWRATLRLYVETGRGLAAAHAAGIVHRDFKPENVMVDELGRARVLDFGLARPARDSALSSDDAAAESASGSFELRLTATGAVMGTPFYMAPEQHRRETIDERADQFSFCVALWEALYGERPFRSPSLPELAAAVLAGAREEPPRGAGIPPWVRRALERGLATEPDQRFASMDDLLAELTRDPSARRRLVAIGAVLVAVPTASVAAVFFASRSEPPCRDVAVVLDDVWGDGARERVRQAFAPLTDADGEEAFERIAARIDDYARAWSEARAEACEATRVRGEQSEQVLELRYSCLDSRAYRLEALLDVLAKANKDVVFQAPLLVAQLPAVEDCHDIARMRSIAPTPSDPQLANAVQEIRRGLARVEMLVAAGQISDVEGEFAGLLEEAEATGYRPLVGDVLSMRGRLAMFVGQVDVAESSLEEAQLLAEAEGYDGLLVDSHLWIAALCGSRKNDFDRAHRHLRRAAAVLERLGNSPMYAARLELTTARVAITEDRDTDAIAAYERYFAIADEHGRPDDQPTVAALGEYGQLLARAGRTEEAQAAITTALERGRRTLGETHPELAGILIYHARQLSISGRHEEALAVFEQAEAIYEKAFGPMSTNLGAVRNDAGLVLAHLGRFEEALAQIEEAAPIVRHSYGEDNVQYAAALANRGDLLVILGRPAEAIDDLERAKEIRVRHLGKDAYAAGSSAYVLGNARLQLGDLAAARAEYEETLRVYEEMYGPEYDEVGPALVGLGEVDLAEGRIGEARARFERAVKVLATVQEPNDSRLARARYGIGRAMHASGDRAAGLALAREAREALARDPGARHHLARADRWLAENAGP